ncbi:hypothetical protein PLESTB_000132500 [Pleodorina starrii]|uniref:Uncharacterized protein n=1 Tax=Pleodorina starrii TaxID=330485 RepID=A0A9W6EXJ2_9CHLO|nr:hypothetical protein PLESTM_000491500 [Pleodorina starrii]GLC48747.1 hypothetical protein PLESTB_000132500 [Pleodorina starrii]GLC74295.1 hypothetical protein PLESTF_001486200 [Pleodorina starrii]
MNGLGHRSTNTQTSRAGAAAKWTLHQQHVPFTSWMRTAQSPQSCCQRGSRTPSSKHASATTSLTPSSCPGPHAAPPLAPHPTPDPTTPSEQLHIPQLVAHAQPQPRPQPPGHGPLEASRRTVLLSAGAVAAAAAAAAGPLVLPSASSAAALSGRPPPEMGFEPRVVEFTLSNGLHFIVLPRRNAPVVACHTYANVGAWNESPGCTGMAHLLEHMAFKGTPRVGSVDFRREAPLLDALDEAFYELRDAKAAVAAGGPGGAGPTRVSTLRARLRSLQEAAAGLAVPNAFGAALQRAGGSGLNATTSHDQTRYFVSLPSNKLELWMALEAERFRAPVFRELYSEKSVIEEERRLRVDNSPMGRYQQEFALASLANNYRRPIIGFEQDFEAIGRREVQAFFDRFYGPANLTIAIVGDADPRDVRRMAERYWGGWQGPPGYQVLPRGTTTATAAAAAGGAAAWARPALESPWGNGEQDPRPEAFLSGSRTFLRAPARSGPAVLLGYYRPPLSSREGVVLDVLADVLAGGRTSRLVSELVLSGKALSASLVSAYPGELHAGLSLVYGVPRDGEGPESVAGLLQQQLAALVEGGVRPDELARVQRAVRAGLLAAAQSNSAMAAALASYHVSTGSWRGLVSELDVVTQLRASELRDVAERVFAPDNCFTGYVLKA